MKYVLHEASTPAISQPKRPHLEPQRGQDKCPGHKGQRRHQPGPELGGLFCQPGGSCTQLPHSPRSTHYLTSLLHASFLLPHVTHDRLESLLTTGVLCARTSHEGPGHQEALASLPESPSPQVRSKALILDHLGPWLVDLNLCGLSVFVWRMGVKV
jgi:hypothetical protein